MCEINQSIVKNLQISVSILASLIGITLVGFDKLDKNYLFGVISPICNLLLQYYQKKYPDTIDDMKKVIMQKLKLTDGQANDILETATNMSQQNDATKDIINEPTQDDDDNKTVQDVKVYFSKKTQEYKAVIPKTPV